MLPHDDVDAEELSDTSRRWISIELDIDRVPIALRCGSKEFPVRPLEDFEGRGDAVLLEGAEAAFKLVSCKAIEFRDDCAGESIFRSRLFMPC